MIDELQSTVTEFSYLFQKYESVYFDAAKKLKIPQVSLYILHVLREIRLFDQNAIITQSDLTKYLSMSKQTIHSALKRLINKGLIKLEAIEGNRKSKNIVVTNEGFELIKKSVDRLNEGKLRAFRKLEKEERDQFIKLFNKFSDIYIDEMNKVEL